MNARNRFVKGSGCFTCQGCGKVTRSTGRGDNEHARCCERCYDMGGDENAVADGDMTQAEFDAKWKTEAKTFPDLTEKYVSSPKNNMGQSPSTME